MKTKTKFVPGRPSPHAMLNPRLDQNFKALFTRNTKESRGALKSFLEAATRRKIKKVNLTANNVPVDFSGQRDIDYDINVVFDDGEVAEVEMQGFRQKYDYERRAVYHASRLMSANLIKGEEWVKVPRVYQISILNFSLENTIEAVNYFYLKNEKGNILTDCFNVIFIELTKLPDYNIEQIQKLPDIYKWAFFLRDADKSDKRRFIMELTDMEDGLKKAREALDFLSSNPALWLAQERAIEMEIEKKMARRLDMEEAQAEGRAKGLAEGRAEGRAKGLAEGRAKGLAEGRAKGLAEGRAEGRAEGLSEGKLQGRLQANQEAALNMHKEGLAADLISRCTGLAADELTKLFEEAEIK